MAGVPSNEARAAVLESLIREEGHHRAPEPPTLPVDAKFDTGKGAMAQMRMRKIDDTVAGLIEAAGTTRGEDPRTTMAPTRATTASR